MDKTELLDKLERGILIIAGDIRVHRVMGSPLAKATEDRLGEMIQCVLELKKLLDVPSNLTIVESEGE